MKVEDLAKCVESGHKYKFSSWRKIGTRALSGLWFEITETCLVCGHQRKRDGSQKDLRAIKLLGL